MLTMGSRVFTIFADTSHVELAGDSYDIADSLGIRMHPDPTEDIPITRAPMFMLSYLLSASPDASRTTSLITRPMEDLDTG